MENNHKRRFGYEKRNVADSAHRETENDFQNHFFRRRNRIEKEGGADKNLDRKTVLRRKYVQQKIKIVHINL